MPKRKSNIIIPKRRWLYPVGQEREYMRMAKQLGILIRQAVQQELPRLTDMVQYSTLHRSDSLRDDIEVLMAAMKSRFRSKVDLLHMNQNLLRIARQTGIFNAKQLRDIMRSAVQVDIYQHEPWLNELTDAWVAENVRLITSVPSTVFDEIEGVVTRGMMEGEPVKRITEKIMDRTNVGDSRARLIARDQIGKLNGDLTKHRQTSIGIDSYIWSTSRDVRVRPIHADREGKVYQWKNPPPDGHPGKPINCRCVALPVINLEKIQYVGMPLPPRR